MIGLLKEPGEHGMKKEEDREGDGECDTDGLKAELS